MRARTARSTRMRRPRWLIYELAKKAEEGAARRLARSAAPTMRRWSRSTSLKASRNAGSAPGRTRASTAPARASGATRRSSSACRRRTSPARCTWAMRSTARSRTSSSAGTGCRASTRSGSPATTTPASRRRTSSRSSSRSEGTSRKELGREAFVERVWRHLEETGRTIMGQFRRLGASLDYEPRALHDGRRLHRGRHALLRPPLGPGLDLPRRTGSSTGARSTRRRSPTSRSCTRTWTTR